MDNRNLRSLDPRWSVPVDPASVVVWVRRVEASAGDDQVLIWAFSAAAAAVNNVPQLEASADGVTFYPATDVSVGDDGTLMVAYAHAGLSLGAGCIARVVAAPEHLLLALGVLAVPQTTIVMPPTGVSRLAEADLPPARLAKPATPPKRRKAA